MIEESIGHKKRTIPAYRPVAVTYLRGLSYTSSILLLFIIMFLCLSAGWLLLYSYGSCSSSVPSQWVDVSLYIQHHHPPLDDVVGFADLREGTSTGSGQTSYVGGAAVSINSGLHVIQALFFYSGRYATESNGQTVRYRPSIIITGAALPCWPAGGSVRRGGAKAPHIWKERGNTVMTIRQ